MPKGSILYLTYDGLTDPLGQSQILPYLLGLRKLGHNITIISFEKSKPAFDQEKTKALLKAASIEWYSLRYHKHPLIFSTLYDLFCLWRKVMFLINNKKIEIIHCRSYITSLIGLHIKKKRNIPFIFDMRGFWADERVEGGLWNLSNPIFKVLYRFFKKKEREFIEHANVVITLTHAGFNEIHSWKLNDQIEVIPCCVDLELFNPASINPADKIRIKTDLNIQPSEFVLVYLGSLGTWYLVNEMIQFYESLRKRMAPSRFLILTQDKLDLEQYPWKSEVIIRNVPRNDVPLYISLANASVFFIKPSYSKKASSPTKMGEIMAMNIPFVTNQGWGDCTEILKKYSGGKGITHFDEAAFVEAIENLVRPHSSANFLIDNYFSLATGIQHYNRIYSGLMPNDRG